MTSDSLRRFVLALLFLGLAGMSVELLLLGHYESATQLVPLGAIALALACLAWHAVSGTEGSVQAVQVVMTVLVVVGLVGVVLHYRGNMEFQLDIDPTQSNWALFSKVMRAKAPPALAPGAMSQLGLLGLAYAWRHPVTRRPNASSGD
jgi:hypothetical protein